MVVVPLYIEVLGPAGNPVVYHIPVCPGCCVNLPKGREEEEQKTDRQISYMSRNLSRSLWFFF